MQTHLLKLSVLLVTFALLNPAPSRSRAQTPQRKSHALLVGIGQYGFLPERFKHVAGAVEDVTETAKFLQAQYGFAATDIHCLVNQEATRARILTEFRTWLIQSTGPGDRVFLLFSGHGTQLPDLNGDEAEHDPADKDDEALVPYDAAFRNEMPENFILDDELNELIAQLAGRLGVLVFDSCTSGTISRAPGNSGAAAGDQAKPRYLPSPAQLAALRAGTRGPGGGVVDYEVRDTQQTPDGKQLVPRNLKLVEEKLQGAVSGLVVISAARAGQTAFPLKTDEGGYRGALSYLFNKIQLDENRRPGTLTFKQLRDRLLEQIGSLQREQRLKGTQVPAFEVLSKYPLEELPLFAGAQAQVEHELPLANATSKLRVELRTNENKRQYRLGDDISYTVKTSAAGWVYLLVFSQENVASCIFPTNNADSYRAAGTLRSETFEVKEPLGKDVTIALLSSVKLKLGDKEVMSWDEVFERLRSKHLRGYVNTRAVGTKKPGQPAAPTVSLDEADWQAASLVIETIAKPAGRTASAKPAPARPARGVALTLNNPQPRSKQR